MTFDWTFQTHLLLRQPLPARWRKHGHQTWPGGDGASHQRIPAAVGEAREAGLQGPGHPTVTLVDSTGSKRSHETPRRREAARRGDERNIWHGIFQDNSVSNYCPDLSQVLQVWPSYPILSRDMQVWTSYPILSWVIPINETYTWISRVICDWHWDTM